MPRASAPVRRLVPEAVAEMPVMVLPLGDLHKTRIVPIVTYVLIAANVVIYVVQREEPDSFTVAYAATPYEITHNVDLVEPVPLVVQDEPPRTLRVRHERRPELIDEAPGPYPIWLTLFTALFLHGSPLHLAGNMLYLWIFGDNVEEVLGGVRYLIIYLACGLVGSLLQIAAQPNSLIPTLGASGAIAGVMGAYVIWFPHHKIRVLVFRYVTEMPALMVIGLWILMQVWEGLGSLGQPGDSGGVAYLAHVGGALTGIFVAFLFNDRAEYQRRMNESREGWFYAPE
jgi:membrane associated rhomboid family serine protease